MKTLTKEQIEFINAAGAYATFIAEQRIFDARESQFFIAGFQECIKWQIYNEMDNGFNLERMKKSLEKERNIERRNPYIPSYVDPMPDDEYKHMMRMNRAAWRCQAEDEEGW